MTFGMFGRTRFLARLLSPHWPWGLLGLVFALVCAGANIGLLAISGWFITGMAVAWVTHADFNYLVPSTIIRACAIGRTGGRYLERLLTHDASLRIIATLRPQLFYGLSRNPALARTLSENTDTEHGGAIAAQLGSDLDLLQRFYLQILVPALVAAGIGGLVLWVTASHSGLAAGVLGGGLFLGGVLLPWSMARAGRRPGQDSMALRTRLRTLIVDGVAGREELLAFGALGRHGQALDDINNRLAGIRRRIAFQDAVGAAILPALANLVLWGVLLALVPAFVAGQMSGLTAVMLVFLALASFELLGPLPEAFQKMGATTTVLDRVMDLQGTDAPPSSVSGQDRPSIRLENIRVAPSVPGAPAPLDGVSLALPWGRKIGLVGASGAGKSTLAQVLAGQVPWAAGRVVIGDHDAGNVNDPAFQGLVSLAPQTPAFLSDTVRRNLQIARANAPEADLRAVLETVCLTPWLDGLPHGLDTLIGEGGRPLSGGEARRLSVARALLGAGPVLVLDEPGEGLDPLLEARMLEGVMACASGRSVVLMTHRPQGLEYMDVIVTLDQGRVLEQGAPWDLLKTNGPFRLFLERAAI